MSGSLHDLGGPLLHTTKWKSCCFDAPFELSMLHPRGGGFPRSPGPGTHMIGTHRGTPNAWKPLCQAVSALNGLTLGGQSIVVDSWEKGPAAAL